MSVKIQSVQPHSPAARAGIRPGELLLEIDGNGIEDFLDYRFFMASENVNLLLRSEKGEERKVHIRKGEYEDLGMEFGSDLMDEQRSCRNQCIFCFIDQMPPGMRPTLYFKDDDARLSFLYGNYITLTNLSEHDIERTIRMKISPVNISVHTTNPELRCRMMHNRFAGEALKIMDRFAEAGIAMNAQLVLCPGINDGAELERSLTDLLKLAPALKTISCVPVGLTKYREGLYPLRPYTAAEAAEVVDILERFGENQLKIWGDRICYASDEFYLLAGREIPDAAFYGDFNQLENGVGMLALQRQQFMETLPLYDGDGRQRRVSIVTGQLAAPQLKELAGIAREKWPGVECLVYPIINDFFGHNITVAGLVTGRDIISQLKGKDLGETLLFPDSMLKFHTDVFLDDVSQGEIEEALGVKMTKVDAGDGGCLLEAMIGETV